MKDAQDEAKAADVQKKKRVVKECLTEVLGAAKERDELKMNRSLIRRLMACIASNGACAISKAELSAMRMDLFRWHRAYIRAEAGRVNKAVR